MFKILPQDAFDAQEDLQQKKKKKKDEAMDKKLMVEDLQTRAYTPRLIDKKAPTTSGHFHKKTKHVGQA